MKKSYHDNRESENMKQFTGGPKIQLTGAALRDEEYCEQYAERAERDRTDRDRTQGIFVPGRGSIIEGYYSIEGISCLLRANLYRPETIRYIAEMMD